MQDANLKGPMSKFAVQLIFGVCSLMDHINNGSACNKEGKAKEAIDFDSNLTLVNVFCGICAHIYAD